MNRKLTPLERDVLAGSALPIEQLSDPYVKRTGSGMAYCSLCDKKFESSRHGFRGHIQGVIHRRALAQRKSQ